MNAHDTAQTYADNGWHIIPIPPGLKHPNRPNWQHHATTNPNTIDQWWTTNPDHGIGIATGAASGLFVIDVDVADGKTGDRTLADLETKHGELPETYTVATPTGGWHHYYRYDPDRPLGNGTLGPDIDTRGEGGQVLAPPTTHPKGGQYTVRLDVPVADAPQWVYDILTAQPEPEPKRQPQQHQNGIGDDDGPAQDYANNTNWHDLLTNDGWIIASTHGTETRWTRPGKNPRDGASATTGHEGRDVLKVFTSSVPELEPGRAYSRFGYYAATQHHGDRSAAARQLLTDGYGTTTPIDNTWAETKPPPANINPATGEIIDDNNWPDIIPLGTTDRTLPPFPVDTLPKWISDHVHAVATDIQVPVDLPATLALACLSLITAGRIKVAAGNWETDTNLYLVVAMPPGTGKSPVFAAMTRGLEQHETDLAAAAHPTIVEAETRRRIHEKASKKAEEKGDADLAYQHQLDAINTPVPATPRLIADDATPEAMVELLAQQNGRLALLSTEGGLFDIMTGRYSDKANLDPYLQAWSGDTIRVDRIGRTGAHIKNATLTIGLTVQPATIAALADRPELAGRGLTARFMYSVPHDNVGTRNYTNPSNGDKHAATTYHTQIVRHYTDLASYQTAGTLTLDDQADHLFRQWRQHIEHRRIPTGDLRPLAEWTTKLEASVLRTAGLLHVAHGGTHHGTLDAHTIAQAIRIGDYWTAHAFAVHDLWGTDSTLNAARKVLAWIGETGNNTFTLRDVYRDNRRLFPRAADAVEPLELLTERGYIRPTFDGPVVVGRRGQPSPMFAVSPLHTQSYPQAAGTEHMTETGGNEDENDTAQKLMRAMSEQNDQKNVEKEAENGFMRAMRAMSLKTYSEELTHSLNPDPHGNTLPSAHGAHGAHDPNHPQSYPQAPHHPTDDIF